MLRDHLANGDTMRHDFSRDTGSWTDQWQCSPVCVMVPTLRCSRWIARVMKNDWKRLFECGQWWKGDTSFVLALLKKQNMHYEELWQQGWKCSPRLRNLICVARMILKRIIFARINFIRMNRIDTSFSLQNVPDVVLTDTFSTLEFTSIDTTLKHSDKIDSRECNSSENMCPDQNSYRSFKNCRAHRVVIVFFSFFFLRDESQMYSTRPRWWILAVVNT